MAHPTISRLLQQTPILLDGAWGTELQKRGLAPGECPESWNCDQPERVLEIPAAYVQAGSRIVLTNTFGGNRLTLARHDRSGQVASLNHAGVAISRRAATDQALVFASIGPSGCMLAAGDVTEEEWQAAFSEQARELAQAGADGLVLETFGDPDEIRIALSAAKATGLPVVLSLTYLYGAKADRTMSGLSPEQSVELFPEADVIGLNCGQGPETCVELVRRLHAATGKPVWCKPNAGLPVEAEGRWVYRETPEHFAAAMALLVEAGATFVGGCCGTSPEHIAAVRKHIAP